MTIKEQKIEIGKCICRQYGNCKLDRMECPYSDCFADAVATEVIEKGYRKVDEGSVVFSKEEYHEIVEQYDKDFDNYKDGENNARVYYENIVIPRLLKQKETNYKIGLGKSQSWVKKLKADIEKLQNENYILAEQVRKETAKEIASFVQKKLNNDIVALKIKIEFGADMDCIKIEGYENYSITSTGIVINNKTNCVKKQFINRKGYPVVTLYKDSQAKNIPIHRLVANAYIVNGDNKSEVNHKNGIKTDNRVENLEWVTSAENSLHRSRILRNGNIKPVRCVETGVIYPSGLCAAKSTHASSAGIYRSCKDIRRKAMSGGLHWEFLTESNEVID